MRVRLLCALLIVCCACVKRIAPTPGPSRTALSGVGVPFGDAQELPEGTTLHWQFGDGTPEQVGAQVVHVFPRAGSFTVVETVVDKDAEKRSAEVQVTVARRSVAAAVPADARSALIAERPWARVDMQRKAAERIGLGELFTESEREFSELFGFSATDPKAAEDNGVNTDEGLGLYTVPQDLEALVACASVSDPAKAAAALQHLLAHDKGGAFVLHAAKLADGTDAMIGERAGGAEKIGYFEHLGYLYLRVPGASDPLLALSSAAALKADAGLEKDPGFNAAVSHVGSGDAIFYSAGREGDAVSSRFANQIGASAFAIQVSAEQIQIRAFGQPRSLTGKALVDALTPSGPPPDFASQLPVGAAFYARASGNPATLWKEFLKPLGPDGAALRDRLRDAFGTDIDKLMPSFTGNGAVALYLDAQSLIEALLGEQVASLDRSTFVTVSELKPGADAPLRAALEHAAHDSGGGKPVRGATFWKLSDGIQVAIRDNLVFAAIGGAPELETAPEGNGGDKGGDKAPPKAHPAPKARAVRKPPELTPAEIGPLAAVLFTTPGSPMLAAQLKGVTLPTTSLPSSLSSQLLWIDIHGTLARFQAAADEQGGMVGMAVRRVTDRARGLRDALVDAHPEPDGILATITLRIQPETIAPAR